MGAVGPSAEVDACIVVAVELGKHHRLDDVGALLAAVGPAGVPLALSLIGPAADRGYGGLPTFPTPERAAVAVALAARPRRLAGGDR